MKRYSTMLEFLIGLLGVFIHSVIVIFIVAYLANPNSLLSVIEATTGDERALLEQFISDVEQLRFMVYAGSAIVIFEWIAVMQIRKHTNRKTPIWALFLILGSLYAYFYFGGLEVFVLLLTAGLISLIKFYKKRKTI